MRKFPAKQIHSLRKRNKKIEYTYKRIEEKQKYRAIKLRDNENVYGN